MKRFNTPFPLISCSIFLLLLASCLVSRSDTTLFLQLNAASQALPDSVWGFLTTLSDPIVAPLLIFSLFHRNLLFLRAFFIAIILALISNYSLKYGFDIQRPPAILDPKTFSSMGPEIASPSFPSGHTLTIFTLMGLLSIWYQKRSISIIVLITAAVLSFARISVGAHWPSDVLAGAFLGCLLGWIAVEINSKLAKEIPEKLLLTMYFAALFAGITGLVNKTPYAAGQWLSTAVALFAIAYALKSITEILHRQKG